MSQRSLHFSSRNRQKVGVSEALDFMIKFDPTSKLPSDIKHEMAVNRILMTCSWHNSMPGYENKTIKYSVDGGVNWTIITFVNGMYSYTDLEDFIHEYMRKQGHVKSDKTFEINLKFLLSSNWTTTINLISGAQNLVS